VFSKVSHPCCVTNFLWIVLRRCRYLDCILSNGRMIDECWDERMLKIAVMSQFEILSCRCQCRDRKTRKICQDSWCPCRDSNWAPPKYESEALPLQPTRLVKLLLLRARRLRGRSSSPGSGMIFLLSTSSRSVLGPTKPSIQWVRGQSSRVVKLTTHIHLVPRRSWKRGSGSKDGHVTTYCLGILLKRRREVRETLIRLVGNAAKIRTKYRLSVFSTAVCYMTIIKQT
jgi:hypothetical protein